MGTLLHPTLKFDKQNCPEPAATGPAECASWSPYVNNGGSTCAAAGKDFAIICPDTRTSQGYSILSREQSKWIQLTKTAVLGTNGMRADIQALWNAMKWYVTEYAFAHKREPSVEALAQKLSTVLYMRRFFPYYAGNLLVGISQGGQGVVYSYDGIGSYEPSFYAASGNANEMLLPVLDNVLKDPLRLPQQSEEEIGELLYAAMRAAAEREITTGDSVDLVLVKADGITVVNKPLRKD
eukprot:Protomagalhaensia_sp_Gyna_25__3069@NODE_281_length_4060_cov_232_967421_g216_i0_p3_GENE_NODE_281_length_4060_cov_232_967421_g216_i0NODE_281_length_4060_cov_232_967421_g216_i0_p3_ORF_typecomplete_len238_score26_66Proteasome/PF00227_26/4_4e34_NODE_281_length_4060_cov_232_967421_g216_i017812494